MVCLATAGHERFYPDDCELRRSGPSYTVDTLLETRRTHPGTDVYLIVGSDNLSELPSWHSAEQIFGLCTVAVVVRPEEPEPEIAAFPKEAVVEILPGRTLPVSATEIRERVSSGRPLEDLVPGAVAEYIAKRGLYR
jgi:nicotinate-nucleotide adenylyltransferase